MELAHNMECKIVIVGMQKLQSYHPLGKSSALICVPVGSTWFDGIVLGKKGDDCCGFRKLLHRY